MTLGVELASDRVDDLLLIEKGRAAPHNGAAGQIQALFDKAGATVMLVRSAQPG